MILEILNSLPLELKTYKIKYTNSYALLFRKIPVEYTFIFRYLNVFVLFCVLKILLKKGNTIPSANNMPLKEDIPNPYLGFKIANINTDPKKTKFPRKTKNFYSNRNSSTLPKYILELMRYLFSKENMTIFQTLPLVFIYSSSPLIHFQLFISGITFFISFYPFFYPIISFNPIAHVFILRDYFYGAINPKIPLLRLITYTHYLVPLFIHCIVYLYSLDYIPPNASFDYIKGARVMEKVDLYVLDRSIITLINEHTQSYLNANLRTGNKNVTSIWRIIKAHQRNEADQEKQINHLTEHERLFVKNNDIVMLENLSTNKYLNSENCDKKYCTCGVDKNPEYWKISSDTEYVMTRMSKVAFRNMKTGKYLSMKSGQFYTSFDLVHKSRLFYIEDSKMEDFYKRYLPNEKVNFSISAYPQTKNYKRATELFLRNLENNDNFHDFLFLRKSNTDKKGITVNAIIHNLGNISTALALVLATFNYVLYKKYDLCFYFQGFAPGFVFYFMSLLPMMIFGTTIDFYMSCSFVAITSMSLFYIKYIVY